MRRLVFLIVGLLLSVPSFSQAKHPFTFEDMMALKRVGSPQVSPDGKWVLFSVVDVDLAANTRTPHVWVVPISGGQEREIIKDQRPIHRAGRRTASDSRLRRRKKAARRSGSQTSMARVEVSRERTS